MMGARRAEQEQEARLEYLAAQAIVSDEMEKRMEKRTKAPRERTRAEDEQAAKPMIAEAKRTRLLEGVGRILGR